MNVTEMTSQTKLFLHYLIFGWWMGPIPPHSNRLGNENGRLYLQVHQKIIHAMENGAYVETPNNGLRAKMSCKHWKT